MPLREILEVLVRAYNPNKLKGVLRNEKGIFKDLPGSR